MTSKITQLDFLQRAKEAHGDTYDYSNSYYVGNKYKVKIICKKHGEFSQVPSDHWGGHGCAKCSFDALRSIWTEEEDAFLKENYANRGGPYCAVSLNKGVNAIHKRAQIVGASRKQVKWLYNILPRKRWSAVLKRAMEHHFEFNLTPEYIEKLFLSQNKKCALTGWDIVFSDDKKINTASIDRIDSNMGYTVGNVQITHKRVNRCKLDNSDEDFFLICKSIYGNCKNRLDSRRIEWAIDPWHDTDFPVAVYKQSIDEGNFIVDKPNKKNNTRIYGWV